MQKQVHPFFGSITDRVDADAELGNIVLKLSQSKDDFDYEIDSDLGKRGI